MLKTKTKYKLIKKTIEDLKIKEENKKIVNINKQLNTKDDIK
jgi:hypothetical protein